MSVTDDDISNCRNVLGTGAVSSCVAESVHLLGTFDEEDCTYCDGDPVMGGYKDNDTIVCDDCGTPAVQLW